FDIKEIDGSKTDQITYQFLALNYNLLDMYQHRRFEDIMKDYFSQIFKHLLKIGELLGFGWDQIEQAYLDKNKINHERQKNGYRKGGLIMHMLLSQEDSNWDLYDNGKYVQAIAKKGTWCSDSYFGGYDYFKKY